MKKSILHSSLKNQWVKAFRILWVVVVFFSCTEKEAFNIVLLPDTQIYSLRFPDVFLAQTQWIAENADSIVFVLHQGDITHNNTDEEWKNAVNALFLMDGKVPYTFVAGNHDLGPKGSGSNRDSELMNQYLPYEKYSRMKGFGGAFEPDMMDNTWHTFKAGGYNWLILSLEFGPRNKVLDWANDVIAAHPRHKVIINTHAYMYSDNTRMSPTREHNWVPQRYGVGKQTGEDEINDGEMMWEKLVSRHPNIMFVFSGHVLNSGVGKEISVGTHGNKVYQMLANYQMGTKGGNGFLRIIRIDPKQGNISVKTYSPYINEYNIDPEHQFVIENVRFK